jgi:protein involved in sex pheromone biosynthesis
MESLFIYALKDYLPAGTIFLGVIIYLYFQNKARAREFDELKQFLNEKFEKFNKDINDLNQKHHELSLKVEKENHRLEKKIIEQEAKFVGKTEFIALDNDISRRLEMLMKELLKRDEKFRAEIKEVFHLLINKRGANNDIR